MTQLEEARSAKRKAAELLRNVPQLAGLGITRIGRNFAIKLNLNGPLSSDVKIPRDIDGVPIKVEFVGKIRAY
jgi:hypothetical protein